MNRAPDLLLSPPTVSNVVKVRPEVEGLMRTKWRNRAAQLYKPVENRGGEWGGPRLRHPEGPHVIEGVREIQRVFRAVLVQEAERGV